MGSMVFFIWFAVLGLLGSFFALRTCCILKKEDELQPFAQSLEDPKSEHAHKSDWRVSTNGRSGQPGKSLYHRTSPTKVVHFNCANHFICTALHSTCQLRIVEAELPASRVRTYSHLSLALDHTERMAKDTHCAKRRSNSLVLADCPGLPYLFLHQFLPLNWAHCLLLTIITRADRDSIL